MKSFLLAWGLFSISGNFCRSEVYEEPSRFGNVRIKGKEDWEYDIWVADGGVL